MALTCCLNAKEAVDGVREQEATKSSRGVTEVVDSPAQLECFRERRLHTVGVGIDC